MAIEGPLRELGIHDVFQLLDLSRKTGRLRVTSTLRDNEGTVDFREGRVIGATIRSNPHPIGQILLRAGRITEAELEQARAVQAQPGERRRIGDILVSLGALTERELGRQIRRQIEAVVFELMSWQEGFFSFSEGDVAGRPGEPDAGLSTESLLMEAARRIDEWARIAHVIPSLSVVPALAPVGNGHEPVLDLRPNEWELLAAVDGGTDLRTIAAAVGISDFDAARIVYGLVTTGVLHLREPAASVPDTPDDAVMLVSDAREALRDGRPQDALASAERTLALAPDLGEAHGIAGQALAALDRPDEAAAHLQRALEHDPTSSLLLMAAARLALRRGELTRAIECWQRVLAVDPRSTHAEHARQAIAHAARLNALVEVGDGA
jgi:hypothetical protein